MTTTIQQWATRWSVPAPALVELRQLLTPPVPAGPAGGSEAAVQGEVRLALAKRGELSWRNNVGALLDQRGIPVRYGLANDTKAMNLKVKSADLIGIRPVLITQAHVGQTIGQFASYECKHRQWKWSGDDHELAQLNWATLVWSAGGHAEFTTGEVK